MRIEEENLKLANQSLLKLVPNLQPDWLKKLRQDLKNNSYNFEENSMPPWNSSSNWVVAKVSRSKAVQWPPDQVTSSWVLTLNNPVFVDCGAAKHEQVLWTAEIQTDSNWQQQHHGNFRAPRNSSLC